MSPQSTLDTALEQLHSYGPDLTDGFFNHAPMVVEALHWIGHSDRAPAWLRAQQPTFTPRPPPARIIDPDDWNSALGDRRRCTDWSAFFESAIRETGWELTLDIWAARLVPGLVTGATHGVIKTGHAVRALAANESQARCRELADALAAWASRYTSLPVSAEPNGGDAGALDALSAVALVPAASRPGEGPITAGYAAVARARGFAGQVARLDVSGDPASLVDDLIVAFAHLFLSAARTPFTAIVFTHAVTASAAVGHLLPYVGAATQRALVFRAFEAGCALKAAFAESPEVSGAKIGEAPLLEPECLDAAAAEHGDDHVIKLTEACTSTWARRSEPVLLRTAARVTELVPR